MVVPATNVITPQFSPIIQGYVLFSLILTTRSKYLVYMLNIDAHRLMPQATHPPCNDIRTSSCKNMLKTSK